MIDIVFQIILIILVTAITYFVYNLYKLPNRIIYISCFSQIREVKTTTDSLIFLFTFINDSYANIEKVEIVLELDSLMKIVDHKFYDRNLLLNKVENNELHFTIQKFNRWDQKVFKICTENNNSKSFQFISNTIGIKIRQKKARKFFIYLVKVWEFITSPFIKINDPLLNSKTVKKEKRKRINIIAIIGTASLLCFILVHYKTLGKNLHEIFSHKIDSNKVNIPNNSNIINRTQENYDTVSINPVKK